MLIQEKSKCCFASRGTQGRVREAAGQGQCSRSVALLVASRKCAEGAATSMFLEVNERLCDVVLAPQLFKRRVLSDCT